MVLSRAQIGTIEEHFWYHNLEVQELHEIRMAAYLPGRESDGMPRAVPKSQDKVGKVVADLETETRVLAGWVESVKSTFEFFSGSPEWELLQKYYVENESRQQVCRELFISRRTFFSWRSDALCYAAIQAAKRGILDI